MALITANILIEASWEATDVLELVVGDEGAADLASSLGGGRVIARRAVWPDGVQVDGVTHAQLQAHYPPTDKCATLPVGVRVRDAEGNVSDVEETLVQLADRPRGVRNVTIAATDNPLEVALTWTESPDV